MRHITGALVGLALLLPAPVLAAAGLSLPVGGERIVDFGKAVATFYIADPNVVDARALDDHRVMLMGRKAGASPVIAYDAGGARVYTRRVRVGRVRRASGASRLIVRNGTRRTVYACTAQSCRAYSAEH